MLNSLHLPTGFELLFGGVAVPALVVASAVIVLVVLGGYAFRHPGQSGLGGMLWGGALVLLGTLAASIFSGSGGDTALRRSVETRSADLTARAIAPGSALACLDAVVNADVETACEKTLFASPEAVATAVAYVDARISLLVASAPLAARDAEYQPSFERARRALEADRYGLVAHVLMTRGCTEAGCSDLKMMQDSGHILANMKSQTFDSYVSMHASAWHLNGSGALAAMPPAAPAVPPQAAVPQPGIQPAATVGSAHGLPKFDYPSAASIPAVSIMNAEPALPASADAEPKPAAGAAPPRRGQKESARRPSAREAQTAPPSRSALPPPPALPAPQNSPPQDVTPQTSGQR